MQPDKQIILANVNGSCTAAHISQGSTEADFRTGYDNSACHCYNVN